VVRSNSLHIVKINTQLPSKLRSLFIPFCRMTAD
jgi:hypothetical protein